MAKISTWLIRILAVYSIIVVAVIFILNLGNPSLNPKDKARIMMALGLVFLWVLVCGILMYRLRDKIKNLIQRIPLGWKLKFVLFCIFLALFEEVITVSMTNLAPYFGSKIGEAYITASTNYFYTVLFHSVIAFWPTFVILSYLLGKYDLSPNVVFLLFGLWGSIAESSINPTALIAGAWFFVYGLMVYVPAYCVPEKRNVANPTFKSYLFIALMMFLGFIFGGLSLGIATFIRKALGITLFVNV